MTRLASTRCQCIVAIGGNGLPAISAAVPATTTTGPLLLGSGLIDLHWPALIIGAVELVDCRVGFRVTRHFDEAKALALASGTISNQPA